MKVIRKDSEDFDDTDELIAVNITEAGRLGQRYARSTSARAIELRLAHVSVDHLIQPLHRQLDKLRVADVVVYLSDGYV